MASNSIDVSSDCEPLNQWLQQVFGDEPVPSFDLTNDLKNHLEEVMKRDKALTAAHDVYVNFSNLDKDDYVNDSNRMTKILETVGLDGELGSESLSDELRNLECLASSLGLNALDDSAYVIALVDLVLEKERTTAELSSLNVAISSVQSELTSIARLNSQLENIIAKKQSKDLTSKKDLQTQTKEKDFLSQKVTKYKLDKKKNEEQISRSGLRSELTHASIVKDNDYLNQLKSQLNSTKEQLQMYANLPPDQQLADVKLAVAKAELQDLEDALSRQIDIFHL